MPGMLLHIDGSKHCWFQNSQRYDLIVILDDATSEIYYAQLVEEESTRTVMAGLREVIETKGLFCALYSDRGSHFFVTPKAGEPVDKHRLTQVGRALKELGVQMIPAYSPQARGRSERNFGTWQGRLPQELRLAGISTWKRPTDSCASTISTLSTASSRCGGTEGECLPAYQPVGSGLGLHGANGTGRGQRQHRGHRRTSVADREVSLPQHAGWLYGDDSRTSGRTGVAALRPACGGAVR
jgi:hypothetical protein